MAYDKYTYNEEARSISTPRWYDKNPTIDTPITTETFLGYVRDSRDPQRMGRLLVWIPELTGDANKEENWIICHYCSPFGGATLPRNDYYRDDDKSDVIDKLYNENSGSARHRTPTNEQGVYGGRQSYGMWFAPPDIGNEVLITFINGDINFGVWFGVLFQQDMNHMIPGIAEGQIFNGSSSSADAERGPVIEPDFMIETSVDTGSDSRKIAYSPLRDGLKNKQGLNLDRIRGQSTSSAQREAPSEVFGILTPDGNQFVMDDKQDQEFIRLRTKSGAQLLIHQTEGMIYAISKDGRTWIEIGNEGNIDIYGSENISIHAENANVNVKSGQDINLQAEQDINIRAGRDFKLAVGGDINIKGINNITMDCEQTMSISSGAEIAIESTTDMGITSTGTMFLNGGPNILLNTVPGPLSTFPEIPETHMPPGPSTFDVDKESWVSGEPYPENTNTIPRVPQHEPWSDH